ncbi:unnamed protein product [Spirodela intermedia]|uniref:Uncharacterized protein n=1 Tax=Spirodela intermedia TaxID=51605 RepID=A0A7I8JEZ4_SPIIN|nr:unnamed protein product [Spirodela intermedia]CAA6668325.1 unnamed protein product [Spirodela intermedia]
MGCGYSKLEPDEERETASRRAGSAVRIRAAPPAGELPPPPPPPPGSSSPRRRRRRTRSPLRRRRRSPMAPAFVRRRRSPEGPPLSSSDDDDEQRIRRRRVGGEGRGRREEGGGKRRSVAEERGERKRKDSAEREEGEGVRWDLPGSPSFRFYFTAVPIRDSADDEEYLIPAEKTSRKEMHSRLGRKDSTDSRASEEGDGRAPKRFRGRGLKGLTKGTGSVYALFKVRSSYGGGGANNSSSLVPEKVA